MRTIDADNQPRFLTPISLNKPETYIPYRRTRPWPLNMPLGKAVSLLVDKSLLEKKSKKNNVHENLKREFERSSGLR